MKKILKTMTVRSGSLRWSGKAETLDHAIIQSLSTLPESAGELLAVHDGTRWRYVTFETALKIAGYHDAVVIDRNTK